MSDLIKRLHEQRRNVWEQAKALADTVATEGRATFSAEEEQTWQRYNADIAGLDTRIKGIADGEKRSAESDAAFNELTSKPAEVRGNAPSKADELRAFATGNGPKTMTIDPDGVDFRVLGKSVQGTITTSGANTVPTSFYARLMEHLIETSGVLAAGPTVLQTESGESLQIPKTTAHGTAALLAEGAAITASDPTFGQLTLGAFKYGQLVQLSRELVEDKGVDLEGYLARATGRALGNAFGAHLVTGAGTTTPRGIVTDATVGVTGPVGTSTSFGTQSTAGQGGDLFIDLYHSVISPYRNSPSCGWLMRDATAAVVRKLKNSQGDYIWQPGMVAGAPDTILGKPVYIDPNVAAVGVSTKSVVFGDLSAYFVRMVGGVRYERSDEYAFNTDLITFRALMRGDGALVDLTGAVKVFVHGAS